MLHNAIRQERLSPPPPDSPVRLAVLGNIAPSKGQLAFCEACLDPQLQNQLELHLYGSCPATYHGDPRPQEALRTLCQNHPDTLRLHGAYQRSDLAAIFERSDLVVMPSLWHEVYGLIAREALCYGLPLIITDAGGLRDLSARSRVLTLNHMEPAGWSDQLKQWLFQGPGRDWVAYRRLRIPPQDNVVRTSDACAGDLLTTYQRLVRAQR